MTDWNTQTYDQNHDFVWQMGEGVVELLNPQPGEVVLDLGCGTGHLMARIAAAGARVIGFDPSSAMLESARRRYPQLEWRAADARDFDFPERCDAVFSNAALHWIHEPDAVIERVAHHLKTGGRFVAEMGGQGNVAALEGALRDAASALGLPPFAAFNYFPSIGEYAARLERGGLETRFAALFDRPTPLDGEDGPRHWFEQFRAAYLDTLSPAQRDAVLEEATARLRPVLRRENGWFADYRRLRFVAVKSGPSKAAEAQDA